MADDARFYCERCTHFFDREHMGWVMDGVNAGLCQFCFDHMQSVAHAALRDDAEQRARTVICAYCSDEMQAADAHYAVPYTSMAVCHGCADRIVAAREGKTSTTTDRLDRLWDITEEGAQPA